MARKATYKNCFIALLYREPYLAIIKKLGSKAKRRHP